MGPQSHSGRCGVQKYLSLSGNDRELLKVSLSKPGLTNIMNLLRILAKSDIKVLGFTQSNN
jgi:hypothetical protein